MISFEILGEAYVNVGSYTVAKKFKEGYTPIQGITQSGVGSNQVLNLPERDIPQSFNLGANQFLYPVPTNDFANANPDSLYDKGAVNTGIIASSQTLTSVPRFRKVTLLYMHAQDVSSNLLQFDANDYVPVTLGGTTYTAAQYLTLVTARIFRDMDDLLTVVKPQGFNTYGRVLPRGMSFSSASELSSLNIQFVTDSPDGTETVIDAALPVHITPMYIQNGRPMFDQLFLEEEKVEFDDGTGTIKNTSTLLGIQGRLLRWRGGGVTSEYRAPINYDGSSVKTSRGAIDGTGWSATYPREGIVIDGVTYINADEFNVTNKTY